MARKVIGSVNEYDNGQSRVEFVWDGASRDGYAWSSKRQVRLASYRTLREVRAAYERSSNSDGAYGCARLALSEDEHVHHQQEHRRP